MSETRSAPSGGTVPAAGVVIEPPEVTDGGALWRIARDSKTLDLNSSYAYLLWCRDFRDTSRIARVNGAAAGFVTGYRRPSQLDTVVVWQIAVDAAYRGIGLAGQLLDALITGTVQHGVRNLETTITSDNEPSERTFMAFARRWQAGCDRGPLFPAEVFPDGHQAEYLYRIGPFGVDRPT